MLLARLLLLPPRVLTGHAQWNSDGAQDANGIYRLGGLGSIPVFRVPEEVCPDGDLVCIYKNKQLQEDVFLAIGTLLPLHVTDKIEFPGRNTEFGVASYGDMQIMNKGYADVLRITESASAAGGSGSGSTAGDGN